MSVRSLREMFTSMVIAKDPEQIAHHYHPEFQLHSNGQMQSFEDFVRVTASSTQPT